MNISIDGVEIPIAPDLNWLQRAPSQMQVVVRVSVLHPFTSSFSAQLKVAPPKMKKKYSRDPLLTNNYILLRLERILNKKEKKLSRTPTQDLRV